MPRASFHNGFMMKHSFKRSEAKNCYCECDNIYNVGNISMKCSSYDCNPELQWTTKSCDSNKNVDMLILLDELLWYFVFMSM